jgi:hypothetical protein
MSHPVPYTAKPWTPTPNHQKVRANHNQLLAEPGGSQQDFAYLQDLILLYRKCFQSPDGSLNELVGQVQQWLQAHSEHHAAAGYASQAVLQQLEQLGSALKAVVTAGSQPAPGGGSPSVDIS